MKTDTLLEDLFTVYYDARKNKRNTKNALRFEINYESKLFELYEDLIQRKYEISKSICFVNFEPVQREIFAADFRDRIIHHLGLLKHYNTFNLRNKLLKNKLSKNFSNHIIFNDYLDKIIIKQA